MSHSKKAKAAGVSASSFLDLKSELAKQESEFAKSKAAGKTYVLGGLQHPDKKPTVWARSNKGVKSRMTRDLQMEELSRQTIESTREALEKKAKLYDKLKKGKTGGLSEAQYGELLVDFDAKGADDHYSSDSEDVDESLTVPKASEDDDDPIVEYEDEFGRMRTARRSEVPRSVLEQQKQAEDEVEEDPFVVYNPVDHFPVYEPSAERLAAIHEAASEAANPIETHYDASHEVRSKGAAFYGFSTDEQKRQQELEELRGARLETEKARKETGAVDVKAGEVEGMVAGTSSTSGSGGAGGVAGGGMVKSRAVEKRKREIEERRRLLDEKRKKLRGGSGDAETSTSGTKTTALDATTNLNISTLSAPTSTSMMEQQSLRASPHSASNISKPHDVDPFAHVEAQAQPSGAAGPGPRNEQARPRKPKKQWDYGPKEFTMGSADAFLKELERDLVGRP